MSTATTDLGRWTYGDRFTPGPDFCRYCGAFGQDCRPVECMACDSRQCLGNGSGRGTCSVCHYGWLPGWSHSVYVTTCGYKGCEGATVAYAPRVGRVCAEHLDRAKVRDGGPMRTLREYIAERVAHRDSGKGWERWRWVA